MEKLEQINLYLASYKHFPGLHFLNAEAKQALHTESIRAQAQLYLTQEKKKAFLYMVDRTHYKLGHVLK